MAIPSPQLQIAKDLLLFQTGDTFMDGPVSTEWDQQLARLARLYDLFATVSTLAAVAGHAIYSLPAAATRIIAILHNGRALGYTDRATLDLHDPEWELALPGAPRFWTYNSLPGDVDTPTVIVSPREFLVTPAPDGAHAGATAFTLITQQIPTTVPSWLEPILLYLTVGGVAGSDPNMTQPEKGEFFSKLADLWLEIARKQLQV